MTLKCHTSILPTTEMSALYNKLTKNKFNAWEQNESISRPLFQQKDGNQGVIIFKDTWEICFIITTLTALNLERKLGFV